MLQVLYKLKTAKVFDRNRSREDKGSADVSDEDPFAIQIMAWCPESRMLCVAGVSANVIIYRFSKLEVTTEVVQVSNALQYRKCLQKMHFPLPFLFFKLTLALAKTCIKWCNSVALHHKHIFPSFVIICPQQILSRLFQDVARRMRKHTQALRDLPSQRQYGCHANRQCSEQAKLDCHYNLT